LIPLYDIIENNKTNILFIDEVENHLNPEWQELIKDKFEKIVKSIIKQKNYSEETTIQIFYSTHSIILPTSFHSQEIIKLENTKE
jgi:predicted ATP-dependent endonuclease of OLD family